VSRSRDPFNLALQHLRAGLGRGDYAPGQPIAAGDEARRLGLSTSPVREALAWLAGEGLIECGPVNGYVAPRLDAAVIRDRYAFRLHCLMAGVDRLARPADLEVAGLSSREPVPALSERFDALVRAAGNVALVEAFHSVRVRLRAVEEAEGRLFADRPHEAQALLAAFRGLDCADLRRALEAYHARRMAAAPLLALAVQAGARKIAARSDA
jgi:DNA-binding FadR family transcriptional regulator